MGNVCSSGQKKKDADNVSEKSEESPSYQLAERKQIEKKEIKIDKGAPLADPEPISDLSTGQNTSLATNSPTDGNISRTGQSKPQPATQVTAPSDSLSSTPQATNSPCDISALNALPPNLALLQGKPINSRRIENDKKIVLYVLAANGAHILERSVLHSIYPVLQERCSYRGFEVLISDCHSTNNEDLYLNQLNVQKWTESPLEAQGGHEEGANCLAEISRHTKCSYVIPILFLGTSLGTPLVPLTIESHDFTTAVGPAENSVKSLLEKWYILDNSAQPPCYRLKTQDALKNPDESNKELVTLLEYLVNIFSKELKDSYLSTVVEQEINNTILISQELAKRCIWIQTGNLQPKLQENPTSLDVEMNRRLANIHSDLKTQLSEKNLIRIPPAIQYPDEQLAAILESLINSVVDGIVDEHTNKFTIPYCTFGVDRRLLNEVEAVSQHSKILGQNCANFSIVEKIKNYITGASSAPLIVIGPAGSGKSVLTAKVMNNIHTWMPENNLIIRYTGLTESSSHLDSLLGSVAEQISVITNGRPCRLVHDMHSYGKYIEHTLSTTKVHLVVVIDSIDDLSIQDMTCWIPAQLSSNVKIILSVGNNLKNNNSILEQLKQKNIPAENFIELTKFSDEQWRDVLSFGGGDFYAANGSLQLPEHWKKACEKLPLQAKILWWLAWLGNDDIEDTKMETIINKIFSTLESKFSKEIVGFLLSAIEASKNGITESDLLKIFQESKIVGDSFSRTWCKFCWLMGPLLLHGSTIKIMDKDVSRKVIELYGSKLNENHLVLRNHFENQVRFFMDRKGRFKSANVQKFLQLPYQTFKLGSDKKSFELYNPILFVTDLEWIRDKLKAVGCIPVINDIYLAEEHEANIEMSSNTTLHLKIMKDCLKTHIQELNYDGEQFIAVFNGFIKKSIKDNVELTNNGVIKKWQEFLTGVKTTYLEPLNDPTIENFVDAKYAGFDKIMNLGGKGYFVATISTEREEICVWDVSHCKKIRTLKGVPHPTSLCPVGEYGAAVLCKREIKVIDLNAGCFKVTLKGVMNQKMPYFGLHDSQHLVCLSRNRMYVNLMNLESGDCVTTFKAGEDRFLNSLLVSGDGRILVCGDETQKPFPLLVWHLSQRKLLYDLRIPHHDFVTSLSAITHEGSYVCVVAKELNEPTPNFIVVYDLQSGTLFKKWKPSCNTVSLAISQTNACVVAGLEDARILVWDLVTGNCRFSLTGHNAPVTLLKLDPLGKVLLSGDTDARDISIRLWELDSGKPLATYTPPAKILTCEILSNGKYVALALENHANLITLILRNYQQDPLKQCEEDDIVYGNPENEGKVYQL